MYKRLVNERVQSQTRHYSLCAYDTAETHSCLSQNQQLSCSASVYERVVFFATGIGPVGFITLMLPLLFIRAIAGVAISSLVRKGGV